MQRRLKAEEAEVGITAERQFQSLFLKIISFNFNIVYSVLCQSVKTHEVWFLYTTTWFLGQINFLSSWATKKMQLWYDCFKHCIRDPRSLLSVSFSYSFKSTVSTTARITECFSVTTSCKIFSTIHKSIEADRAIFTRHFFAAFWWRRGLIQTCLAIKLRIRSSSPRCFSAGTLGMKFHLEL